MLELKNNYLWYSSRRINPKPECKKLIKIAWEGVKIRDKPIKNILLWNRNKSILKIRRLIPAAIKIQDVKHLYMEIT